MRIIKKCAQNEKSMGNVSGAENFCQRTAHVFVQIVGLRIRRITNAVKAVYHALIAICTESVIGVGSAQSFRERNCAKRVTSKA